MRFLRVFLNWLFTAPDVDFADLTEQHRLLLAEMREDLW